jgi:UDP-glucose 4-epimerase
MAELSGKRVLVTGGAGFVGSHIVDLLLPAGCAKVTAIDNLVRGRRENLAGALGHPRFELIEGDIRDRELITGLVAGADIVFHQAALRITHCAAEPRSAMEVMVDSTFDIVERCTEADVEKLIMASSASIYGMAESFPTGEDHHSHADTTLYGAAKYFGEGLLRAFADMRGLRSVALRYFNVYGPRMDIHGRYTEVLVRWMERIEAGLPPIIFGDGLQTMDMIDVRDVARANVAAATGLATGFFNVGTGVETSLLDLAWLLAEAMGRPQVAPIHQEARKINPVARRLADTRKAAEGLGFRSEIALTDGLADLVAWWRANRTRQAAHALQSAQ